jgi:hypothetical protein
MSNEVYYCMNCGQFGALNEHGRCSTCDSEAIVPTPNDLIPDMKQELALFYPRTQLVARKRSESLMHWASRFLRNYCSL